MNWNCDNCGRHLTPHGDCISCERKQRILDEKSGKRKRAKNLVVDDFISIGDVFKCTPFKIETIKFGKKVFINEGMTENVHVLCNDQWVNIEPVNVNPS